MTSAFDKALRHTLGIEAGYSNHPSDTGKATNHGITQAKAKAWGYTGDMRELPRDLAVMIYREDFWDLLHLDRVAALSEPVALELFDTAVNCGVDVPVEHLQRLLNVFNREQSDYQDIKVDGLIGRNTLAALSDYLLARSRQNGAAVLVEALNSLQGAYYTTISELRPANEAFTFGWFAQRVLKRAAA